MTFLDREKEIRFIAEPDSGDFLLQQKWILKETLGGTQLRYEELYTDERPNAEEIAKGLLKVRNEALLKLKAIIEAA